MRFCVRFGSKIASPFFGWFLECSRRWCVGVVLCSFAYLTYVHGFQAFAQVANSGMLSYQAVAAYSM